LSDQIILESLEIVKTFISHCQLYENAPQEQESEESQESYGGFGMDDVAAESDKVMAGKVCYTLKKTFGVVV